MDLVKLWGMGGETRPESPCSHSPLRPGLSPQHPMGFMEQTAGGSLWRPDLNAATKMAKRGATWERATLQRMSDPKTQTCRRSGVVWSCLGLTVKSPQDSSLFLSSGKCKALAWEAGPLIPGCPIFWDLCLLCKGAARLGHSAPRLWALEDRTCRLHWVLQPLSPRDSVIGLGTGILHGKRPHSSVFRTGLLASGSPTLPVPTVTFDNSGWLPTLLGVRLSPLSRFLSWVGSSGGGNVNTLERVNTGDLHFFWQSSTSEQSHRRRCLPRPSRLLINAAEFGCIAQEAGGIDKQMIMDGLRRSGPPFRRRS